MLRPGIGGVRGSLFCIYFELQYHYRFLGERTSSPWPERTAFGAFPSKPNLLYSSSRYRHAILSLPINPVLLLRLRRPLLRLRTKLPSMVIRLRPCIVMMLPRMGLKARQLPGFKYWDRVCSAWEAYRRWQAKGVLPARHELGSQSPRARKGRSCSSSFTRYL